MSTPGPAAPARKPWLMDLPPIMPAQRDKLIALDLDAAERLFLLVRLTHVREVADAVMAGSGGVYTMLWTRDQVVGRVRSMALFLRADPPKSLHVFGTLMVQVLKDAIENNPYFAQMADHDPRFCVAAIRRAETLRRKLQRLLKVSIVPVFLGDRRGYSLDVVRRGLGPL
jgi:hypothetical protein